jgi:DNA processing protein
MSIEATTIIALLKLPGVGSTRVRKVLERVSASRVTGNSFDEGLEIAIHSVLTTNQISKLSESMSQAQSEYESLMKTGIVVLTLSDPRYPLALKDKLKDEAPLLLLCKGNLNLLSVRAVGFCGSRSASEKGLAAAWDSATSLALSNVNVVSGYAAGVDMTAHMGALKAGGTTTIVLAEGLCHFRIKKDIKKFWNDERILVVSEFGAHSTWSVGHAMQRNKTICALSQALILVEARESGGSFAAGKECLKLGMPLFAAVYQGSPESARGNEAILDIGAKPLMKNKKTNLPNLTPVLETLSWSIS